VIISCPGQPGAGLLLENTRTYLLEMCKVHISSVSSLSVRVGTYGWSPAWTLARAERMHFLMKRAAERLFSLRVARNRRISARAAMRSDLWTGG